MCQLLTSLLQMYSRPCREWAQMTRRQPSTLGHGSACLQVCKEHALHRSSVHLLPSWSLTKIDGCLWIAPLYHAPTWFSRPRYRVGEGNRLCHAGQSWLAGWPSSYLFSQASTSARSSSTRSVRTRKEQRESVTGNERSIGGTCR